MTAPILSVENLTASFARDGAWHSVVRSVSFEIAAGETLAIVGESGSGKSVTALSIMRLLDPAKSLVRGAISLSGRDLLALPDAEMRGVRGNEIAMIFQEPMTSLNPVLPVGFQVVEALRLHRGLSEREAEQETIRLFEKVRIPGAKSRFHEYPHRFSGGMRQRVMIAMALACKPKLLIADEPTTALDVTIQAQTLELIKTLQGEEGMAVLFITHDMGVVAEVADRMLVMYHGDVVETGDTAAIFERPGKPYTKALLSAVPKLGSMQGKARPMRFPVVDRVTGASDAPIDTPETIAAGRAPVLDVRGLTTRFEMRSGLLGRVTGRVHAVEGVSFSVRPGETLALVGESGCGKSTTGRSILRLVEPMAGEIMLDGQNVLAAGRAGLRDARRKVQMIFQDPFASLNPRIEVGFAIAEPFLVNKLGTRKQAFEKAADLLVRVGLDAGMANRYPHEFSGGQRQRICIARALSVEPKLIIADEAVSALDVSVKAQVVNLMLDLQASFGLAFLFISHDMAVVERLSHRVGVMYLGEIVEIGSRADVFGNPQHPYTKRLLSAVPIPDPQRRYQKRSPVVTEIKSPIRTPDFIVPARSYREVTPGHHAQDWSEEWAA